jgi:predicted transcriptional regulator of viral defense system
MVKYYEKMLELGCFNKSKVIELTGSEAAAKSLLYDYQKKGYIEKVKRNLYATISLETKQPVLSRYQIGSRLFQDAVITHHSAFEAFGYANQVFYEVYVATDSRFRDFEYDGIWYHRMEKNAHMDIVTNGKLKVTGLEQTIVDSIKDFNKIAGLEEVIRCIMLIPSVKGEKILEVLSAYDNKFLYHKCGYILEQLQDELGLSNEFFEHLSRYTTDGKRYLVKENGQNVWNSKWKLYVPKDFVHLIDKGVGNYDAI